MITPSVSILVAIILCSLMTTCGRNICAICITSVRSKGVYSLLTNSRFNGDFKMIDVPFQLYSVL